VSQPSTRGVAWAHRRRPVARAAWPGAALRVGCAAPWPRGWRGAA